MTTCHDHIHAIHHDLLGRRGDGHQARCTLAVHGLARHGRRQTSSQRRIATQVHARRADAKNGAKHNVFDLSCVNTGAAHSMGNHVTGQAGRLGVVKRAPVGAANARACGGDDNGFSHSNSLGKRG